MPQVKGIYTLALCPSISCLRLAGDGGLLIISSLAVRINEIGLKMAFVLSFVPHKSKKSATGLKNYRLSFVFYGTKQYLYISFSCTRQFENKFSMRSLAKTLQPQSNVPQGLDWLKSVLRYFIFRFCPIFVPSNKQRRKINNGSG